MLLTSRQVCDILEIHYQTFLYHAERSHYKTAKKFGFMWAVESYEILELREQQLDRINAKNKSKKD